MSQRIILSADDICPCPTHDLVLEIEKPGLRTYCKYCREEITGSYYRCPRCYSLLHKSCLHPSNQIQHPFHPQHPLFLKNLNTKTSCNACRNKNETPTYNCSLCSFCLHFKCSKLTPTMKTSQVGGGEVLQPDHPHILLLCSKDDEFRDYRCDYCWRPLDDLIYVCLECNVSLHKNCAQCPLLLHHPFHPQHRLTLTPCSESGFVCSFCEDCSSMKFCYRCEECEYTLDASCSCFMLTDIRDNTGLHKEGNLTLLQPNHIYSLILPLDFSIKYCGACEELIKDANDPIYFCSECKMFFHKSCTAQRREIETAIDSLHPLTLDDECVKKLFYRGLCTLCGHVYRGFVYRCSANCKIMLHLKCFSLFQPTTTLMSINHDHPLVQLSESRSYDHIICSKCQKRCSFPFFSCFSCELHLHAHCLTKLPTTITSPYHRHPLTLTYSPIKDWPDEPDDADFYCDNCEEKRNLHEAIYYCERCDFVAHFGCVLTQVKIALEEEWSVASRSGDLKYETYDDEFPGKILAETADDLVCLLKLEKRLGKGVENVRNRMKELKEVLVGKDSMTMSKVLHGGSYSSRKAIIGQLLQPKPHRIANLVRSHLEE